MKKKQKRMNKIFRFIGQTVAFMLFSATWSAILVYGMMVATTL
jgi:hypothetical protein